jgi:hypothetical protein
LIALNLLVLPGLGSWLARRRFSGAFQMLAAVAGFVMITIWLGRLVWDYAMTEQVPDPASLCFFLLLTGTALLALSWFWALASSLQIWREVQAQPQSQHTEPSHK